MLRNLELRNEKPTRLVHQSQAPLHLGSVTELLVRPIPPRHHVQVGLQVVPISDRLSQRLRLQERRSVRVDLQVSRLYGDVNEGYGIRRVGHFVPDVVDRKRSESPWIPRGCARHHNANLLAFVLVLDLFDHVVDLLPRTLLHVLGIHVNRGVNREPATVDFGLTFPKPPEEITRLVRRRRTKQRLDGHGDGAEDVAHPFGGGDGPSPGDVDLSAADGSADLVGGDGHIAHPVRLAVPGLDGGGVRRVDEEVFVGLADARGGVDEGDDLVAGGVLQHDVAEEGVLGVAGVAAVGGDGVGVKGVVGGLAEVAAPEDELAEAQVQLRLHKSLPVLAAQDLFPRRRSSSIYFAGDHRCHFNLEKF
ncbi:hypothetical protein TIFTF001_032699 [Ficus carica]|uniref:Uncharacterized protein n=1 Tax=Ficus carica TaxID=3494 RepID=A0AA88DYZ7_FICCA|nr:hypothetical protein TIFTF001_032699 [Ficus carica]